MVFQASHRPRRAGFSLVELLVVITIMTIVVAMLLPAVQAARESARRLQCANNVRQLALAALQHESNLKFFPTGGWYQNWLGHPDRGFGKSQPGGWIYNVLPFLDQQSLHDLGAHGSGMTIEDGNQLRVTTPLSIFNCPSRRPASLFRLHNGDKGRRFQLTNGVIVLLARSDYAMNGGDYIQPRSIGLSPKSLQDADAKAEAAWDSVLYQTGLSYQRSQVTMADIKDGTASTLLLGEKYINARHYNDGDDPGDNTTMYCGDDLELLRWTGMNGKVGNLPAPDEVSTGVGDHGYWFGSAHTSGFNMAFCDGSVSAISYLIDGEVYRRLGNRKDNLPVDASF